MIGSEVFLTKLRCQCHLSQQGDCDYGAKHEKKVDYYFNPYLSQLKDEQRF